MVSLVRKKKKKKIEREPFSSPAACQENSSVFCNIRCCGKTYFFLKKPVNTQAFINLFIFALLESEVETENNENRGLSLEKHIRVSDVSAA